MIGYIWTRESNVYDEEKYSLKSQLDACREAAAADGVSVAAENEYEVQFSGRDLRAIPELGQLRGALERGRREKQRVYCYTQDRLIRGEEAEDIFYLLVEFRHFNTEVRFIKNPLDLTTIAGKIMALVAGHEAAGEIGKIKDRTMRGKLQRVKDGKLWGLGRDKFGYRRNKEAGFAEIHETEAEIVKRLFREVCAGKGLLTIAKDLNRDGVPTSFTSRGEKKTEWHPATVRVLLRDPAYKGEVWAHRYSGELLRMPDGLFPPIVAAEVWDHAQNRLETNRGENKRNSARPALLRGLIFCKTCGARMYLAKQHKAYYYRCSTGFNNHHKAEPVRCANRSARADRIEAAVWEQVLWLINNPERLIELLDLARTVGVVEQIGGRLSVIKRQIGEKEIEQGRLVKRLRQADGRLARLIEKEFDQLEVERERLQAEAEQLELQLRNHQSAGVGADEIYAKCARLAAGIREEVSFEQKRRDLEELRLIVVANGMEWDLAAPSF